MASEMASSRVRAGDDAGRTVTSANSNVSVLDIDFGTKRTVIPPPAVNASEFRCDPRNAREVRQAEICAKSGGKDGDQPTAQRRIVHIQAVVPPLCAELEHMPAGGVANVLPHRPDIVGALAGCGKCGSQVGIGAAAVIEPTDQERG